MPPKPKKQEPSKKTEQKKKEKIIEDKTFGLKNKKGTKQQKFIKQVENQVKQGGQQKKRDDPELDKKSKKEEIKKQKEELNQLFKPVAQTVAKGVDPKSVVCAFFKQGQCSKGERCKFSHDLNLERKGEKRSAYSDVRDDDTMEDWDEQKLEEVVNKKHGESDKSKPKTAIICKFFLEAVENNKYGWFWSCPNGEKCFYRHALPAGFVLKKDQKKEDKGEQISIEELVERERAALGPHVTRVTLETFLQWKEKKRKEKIAAAEKETVDKKKDFKQGKMLGISGRQMFEFNPDLVNQDDDEVQEGVIEREPEEEEEEEVRVVDVDINLMRFQAKESDGTGTISTTNERVDPSLLTNGHDGGGDHQAESEKLSEACALPTTGNEETDAAIAIALAATVNGDIAVDVPIDEGLFEGEDIDQIEDDLETLELDV